jgi:hypothetical protein
VWDKLAGMPVRVDRGRLVDAEGRTLLLRGVNLGGSSKVPTRPDGRTHLRGALDCSAPISFVGRPFSLDAADEHFTRLRALGATLLRWLITWESVEHAGPGVYDEDFLDALAALVERAARHDLLVWIDPHQDVWSRWTGGDGAPAWTLELAGLIPERMHAVGAAVIDAEHRAENGGALPPMIWVSNAGRLGAATMFALFFAGAQLAPGFTIDGNSNIETVLRARYAAMLGRVARRLRGLPNVVGFGSLNEPMRGWLGHGDLAAPVESLLALGPSPTPWESLQAAAGASVECDVMAMGPGRPIRVGRTRLNPAGLSAWDERGCPWAREGVWRPGALLRRDHFARAALEPGVVALCEEVARAVRAELPDAVLFVEGEPLAPCPSVRIDNIVHAPHWYDGVPLVTRSFHPTMTFDVAAARPVFGEAEVRATFARAIQHIVDDSLRVLPDAPVLIGEIGVPFDLAGDDVKHESAARALDAYLAACDDALVGATVWNYTADNTHAHGDGWNGEDLSVVSADEPGVIRGARGLCHPYPRATAGAPRRIAFDYATRTARITLDLDPRIDAPSEIVVPAAQYPDGFGARLEPEDAADVEYDGERLLLRTRRAGLTTLTITPRG